MAGAEAGSPELAAPPRSAHHKLSQLGQRCAQLRIVNFGEPRIEHGLIACARRHSRRARSPTGRRRTRQRQGSLDQNETSDHGAPEEHIDAVDQQRCAMLQVEGKPGDHKQFQRAVAAELLGPGSRRHIWADDRAPFRLEPRQDAAAATGDDRGRDARRPDAGQSRFPRRDARADETRPERPKRTRREAFAGGSVWFRVNAGRKKNAEARWLLPRKMFGQPISRLSTSRMSASSG